MKKKYPIVLSTHRNFISSICQNTFIAVFLFFNLLQTIVLRNSFLVDIKQPLTLIWKHIYSRFFPLTSLSFEMRNNNKKMPDDYNAKDKNIVSNESEQRLLEKCTFIIPIKGTIMEIEYRSENLGSQRLFYEKILRFIYSYFKDRAFVFKDAETIIYNRYFV